MVAPVEVTVFPRLDCCVPDYTGKNRLLGEVLAGVKNQLGDRITVEIVSTSTRVDRLSYYERVLETLLASNWPLPFPVSSKHLEFYREATRLLRTGLVPPASIMAGLRPISAYFFHVTPVIALNGKAVFVTVVPTVTDLYEAVKNIETEREERWDQKGTSSP